MALGVIWRKTQEKGRREREYQNRERRWSTKERMVQGMQMNM